MAKASKKKTVQYRSQRGVFKYPRINMPDTKYHKPGVYKVTLRLKGEAAEKEIAAIQKLAIEHTGSELPVSDAIVKVKGKYRPNEDNGCFQPEFDRDTGEMTGAWDFFYKVKNVQFKDKKSGEQKLWERQPKIFSASGKLANKAKVGGGSEGAVIYEIFSGTNDDGESFMTFQPAAVQVYKLVEWQSGGGIDNDLLDGEDDGWEPDEDDEGMDEGMVDNGSDDDDAQEGEEDF